MIKFIKNHTKLFEIILLFFLSVTPLLWFTDGDIILGHDSGFRLDPVKHLINLLYSWDPSSNFGTDWSWFKGFLITQLPETLFISLVKSLTLGQQLTFIFWFFCIGISMYIFINAFFKEKEYWFFRIFASTFYMYNFFLLQAWFIAERAKFSLFSALPLGVLSIYKTLTREYSILRGLTLFSLVSFLLNAGGNATFYGTLLLTYGITFIYLTVANIKRGGYGEIVYSFKVGILFAVGFLTVNSYWVLPQLYSFLNGYGSSLLSIGGIESIIAWESVITKNASFINLLRLEGIPDWYDNTSHTYAYFFTKFSPIVVLSFIPLFILLFGLMNHRKLSIEKRSNKLIILILLLFLFGLFFTAGSHPPLGNIYVFFIKFVPGFAIFRSAFYKFGGILWFSYIFLISFYISLFISKLDKRKKMYIFLAVFSFCFLLAYHFPFFNSNFFIWNDPFTTKVKIPSYVNDMAEYINKMPASTRILLLPEFDNQADSYQWGFWGIDSLPRLFTNKSIVANTANRLEIIESIYYSLSQNDENIFLRLAGISGINKLLWRDDVLYSDKARTSQNFASIKKNLENFKGVTIEKEIEAWSLYKIESPYYEPLFHSVNNITYAKSNVSKLRSIFKEEENSKSLAILFNKLAIDKSKDIFSFSSKNIIEAKCVACGLLTFNKTKGGLLMPDNIKVLPNSPFYFLSSLKEQQVLRQYSNNPMRRVDADLGYSSKRIVEMNKITSEKVKDNSPRFFVTQAIKQYKTLISDAVEQANMMAEDKRNEAFMRILIYLNSQFYFLGIQGNLYNYDFENFEDLSIFMQDRIKYLGDNIWATDFADNKIRYFITIDNSGTYDITTEDTRTKTITIDGKNLTNYKNIILNKGIHRLEIPYPETENLTDENPATESGKLLLPFGERVKFGIKKFDPKETYFVSFDYKVSQGRPDASIIEKEKRKQHVWSLFLNQKNVWNSFSSIFEPHRDTKSINLEFYPTGFETTGATIQIKNLKVVKVYVPVVLLSRIVSPSIAKISPKISSKRINPTMYELTIENATSSFMLSFGEAYANGWRAYIAENSLQTFFTKPIPETKHYILNGYSNGWLVDKKGSYTIIVEYFPQKIFYVGVFVSMVSLFIAISILLRKKGKI